MDEIKYFRLFNGQLEPITDPQFKTLCDAHKLIYERYHVITQSMDGGGTAYITFRNKDLTTSRI